MNIENKNKMVAYDGYCAFAVSTGKMDVKGGKHSILMDGKTYLFSNPIARLLFKLLPNRVKKADAYYNSKKD